jgi:ferric-dicitrate binding protein FerR (iron transport regulator)
MPKLTPENLVTLANKWLEGTIDEEEKKAFEEWYNRDEEEIIQWGKPEDRDTLRNRLFDSIERKIKVREPKIRYLRPGRLLRYAAASSIIVLLTMVGYFFINRSINLKKSPSGISRVSKDILPASNAALLTLGNGSVIRLEKSKSGKIPDQAFTQITNLGDHLTYKVKTASKQIFYNTLSTPIGTQYSIQLPDGSLVWLNAGSSLRFPSSFIEKNRRVELTGEGYFEVEKNKEKPFIVVVEGMEVQVLGTHFNIKAYDNENSVNTSLLEGSVKLTRGNTLQFIKPGQRLQVTRKGQMFMEDNADMDQVIAWKMGIFNFNNASLETVMREISRWYDVDIVYEKDIPDIKFWGEIQRDLKLADVLEILNKMEVHFKIEGRKLMVIK